MRAAGNSEAFQASRYAQFVAYWHTVDGTGPFIAYTHRDTGAPGDTDSEHLFGLLRQDGSRKPAWKTLRALARAADFHAPHRGASIQPASTGPGRIWDHLHG